MVNSFPITPGLYIAQRESDVVLIRITGQYPRLVLGKGIDLTAFICSGGIKEVDKELLSSIALNSQEWQFRCLPSIEMSVFPKTTFRPDGIIEIDPDTRNAIRTTYYRLSQQGVPYADIMRSLADKHNITMEQMRQLINQFDKEACS